MPSWFAAAVVNRDGRLRNGWWTAAFLAVLAALLAPAILVSANLGHEVTIFDQAVIIALATLAIQALRRRSVFEVTGRPDLRWIAQLALGAALGGLLMGAPALALMLGGWVRWEVAAANPTALWSAALLMAGVAVAE